MESGENPPAEPQQESAAATGKTDEANAPASKEADVTTSASVEAIQKRVAEREKAQAAKTGKTVDAPTPEKQQAPEASLPAAQ